MRHILLLILFGLASAGISQELKEGDTLYIWAESGLNLHKNSIIDSEVITKIPYGKFAVITDKEPKGYYSYKEVDPYVHKETNIPAISYDGQFYKVKYLDYEGYLFGGLVSKLPPILIDYKENKEFHTSESLETYFDRAFGRLKVLRKIGGDSTEYISQRIVYNNGIILDEERGVSWWDCTYIIPDISIYDAYLLINILRNFENYYKRGLEEKWEWLEFHPIYFKENEIKLQSGPFEETIIKKENKFVILKVGGGN